MREINAPLQIIQKLSVLLKYISCHYFIPWSIFIFSFTLAPSQSIKVVFSENFDNSSSLQPWSPYFSSGWFCKEPLNAIEPEAGKGNILKINFPAGSIGSQSGIGNYRIPLDSAYKELYLSWECFVPSNFDFGWADGKGGGKFFGGFAGGSMTAIPNNDATDLDGWASILMWQDGYYSTYNYFKGNPYTADGWPNGSYIAAITKGQWKRYTIRLKMNDGDQANGIFEVFDNDVLVYRQSNAKIVNSSHPEYLIEHIYLNSFFGGSGPLYVSPVDQYMKFDNIVAFYYPRGSPDYREGASESGRKLQIPQTSSFHPMPPNIFRATKYTAANGIIKSHCAFYQPVDHPSDFETSTIEVTGATSISINVNWFDFDKGASSLGSQQILKIYQGTGTNKVLVKTYQNGVNITPGIVTINGNTATIAWQSGQGSHGGFSLNYTSDGTSSGNNFSCNNYVARQGGIPVPVPFAPSSLILKNISSNSVQIGWNDNSDNESWFEIERHGPNDNNLVQTLKSNANTTAFSDAGLQANSIYSYRIRAYNTISGYSAFSNTLEINTTIPIPAAPSNLTITNLNDNSAALRWVDNSNNESWFEIDRRGPNNNDLINILKSEVNTTTFSDAGLVHSSNYTYRVRAYNSTSGYSTWSNTVAVRTTEPVPLAPYPLTVSGVTNNSVSLHWIDNSDNESWFEIERHGPNNNSLIQLLKSDANTSAFTDNGLQTNSLYAYKIRSYNLTSGYSSWSNTIEVITTNVTPPKAPSKLLGKNYTNESITIRWDDNSTDEKGFIITRSLAIDNSNSISIEVNANDTTYTDTGLEPSKSYVYTVKAVNDAGSSAYSNRNVASTLSLAETKRIKENLIAYYNFTYDPAYFIHDLSGYGEPLNLTILQPGSISWNQEKKLEILSNVEIRSTVPAKKIVTALKKSGELTFECWVKPNEPDNSNSGRIISLGINDSEIGFVLDQDYQVHENGNSLHYRVRLQTEATNESGYPEIIQEKTDQYLNLNHIAYVRDTLGKETLFVNGKKTAEGFRPSLFNSWNENFYLRIGNEIDQNHSWKGTFYSIAIYDKALTLDQISRNFYAGPCDSIRNNGLNVQVSIYPNPASDKAFIEVSPLETQDYVPLTLVRILDSFGVTHFEEVIFNPNQPYNKTLDIKNYNKGIYFLQVISGGKQKVSKLIIQ